MARHTHLSFISLQLRCSLKSGILPEPVHMRQSLTPSVELSLGWFPEYQVAHF